MPMSEKVHRIGEICNPPSTAASSPMYVSSGDKSTSIVTADAASFPLLLKYTSMGTVAPGSTAMSEGSVSRRIEGPEIP